MAHKKRKSSKRSAKAKFGKVGNWGESAWSAGSDKPAPDNYNKTMAKAFK
mgnify:CR=1 FL=1